MTVFMPTGQPDAMRNCIFSLFPMATSCTLDVGVQGNDKRIAPSVNKIALLIQ